MQLTGKTALVTGAGGALGSAIVSDLLASGATVFALDISDKNIPPGAEKILCDVTDPAALEKAFSALPAIDILINNAGILHSAPLVNVLNKKPERFADAAKAWQRVIDVNLSSVFYVTQLVADRMVRERKKGVIVNISSVSAQGNSGQSAYAASKAGMNALTMVWAKELGGLGIRAVAVAPGYIDTPSTHKAVTESQLKTTLDKIALKKLGAPESILQAVRFAIENDYVSGTIIEVDGGLVL